MRSSAFRAALCFVTIGNVSLPAVAGNSSSGGGYIYEDQLNPWFLENVAVVNYCIDQDLDVFHVDPQLARRNVAAAIAEWKRAFASAENSWYSRGELEPYGQVRVATQTFVEGPCEESTDLRFQLGVLSEDQRRDHLPAPTSVVASTVRTAYDNESLRARGFIYVAADAGPLRPTSPGIVERPWSRGDGVLLARVLLHELGHVFGLPHFGDPADLMAMQHPELMVQRSTVDEIEQSGGWAAVQNSLKRIRLVGFDDPYDGYECRGFNREQARYFGVPLTWGCLGLRIDSQRISIWASQDERREPILIGRVDGALSSGSKRIVSVKLNDRQRVFTKIPEIDRRFGYLSGPGVFVQRSINSMYRSEDGAVQRAFKGIFKPDRRYTVDGVLDERIVEIFDND